MKKSTVLRDMLAKRTNGLDNENVRILKCGGFQGRTQERSFLRFKVGWFLEWLHELNQGMSPHLLFVPCLSEMPSGQSSRLPQFCAERALRFENQTAAPCRNLRKPEGALCLLEGFTKSPNFMSRRLSPDPLDSISGHSSRSTWYSGDDLRSPQNDGNQCAAVGQGGSQRKPSHREIQLCRE